MIKQFESLGLSEHSDDGDDWLHTEPYIACVHGTQWLFNVVIHDLYLTDKVTGIRYVATAPPIQNFEESDSGESIAFISGWKFETLA